MAAAAELARASPVLELDGPPGPSFEIPLDYFANENGELEPADAPHAVQLVQRVRYVNFLLLGPTAEKRCKRLIQEVKKRLEDAGGGIIWWRERPAFDRCEEIPGKPRITLRFGTSPELPRASWQRLSHAAVNAASDPGFPAA